MRLGALRFLAAVLRPRSGLRLWGGPALAAVLLSAPTAMADVQGIGVVNGVAGQAIVFKSEHPETAAVPAIGLPLDAGDRIVTGPDGGVSFVMNDGARFAVGPNSAVVVSAYPFQRDPGLLAKFAARVYEALRPPADEAKVAAGEAVPSRAR